MPGRRVRSQAALRRPVRLERRRTTSLLAVFLGVGLPSLLGVRTGMGSMSARGVCVVGSLLVMARSVVFGGFAMVLRGLGMVFGRFGVMFRSLLRHRISSSARMILRQLNSDCRCPFLPNRSLPPEILEPVRRQRRVDCGAGDRPMAEPALYRPGVVPLVGERVAAGVAQYVGMGGPLSSGGRSRPVSLLTNPF
jgi:hypothetical protein